MRALCNSVAWLASSTAVVLLCLALLVAPGVALADDPSADADPVGKIACVGCTNNCPDQVVGCIVLMNYCSGLLCPGLCDCTPDGPVSCACSL
jgi:hypothetical protein